MTIPDYFTVTKPLGFPGRPHFGDKTVLAAFGRMHDRLMQLPGAEFNVYPGSTPGSYNFPVEMRAQAKNIVWEELASVNALDLLP
ncbi:MAG: hypothetical protein WBB28_01810 [Crinalium sp.]